MSKALQLDNLHEANVIKAKLQASGLNSLEATIKSKLFVECAKTIIDHGLDFHLPAKAFFVPGRIEILGKHTDYAGGRSIIAAAQKGFCVTAVARTDSKVSIFDAATGETAEFELSAYLQIRTGHWSNYPMTVARRLVRNFAAPLVGADIAFASDLPPASGMSSSSAMLVAFYLILSSINDLPSRPEYTENIKSKEDQCSYLGTIENGQDFGSLKGDMGVGTFGGSEDHTAILCCKTGKLSQYSYCPVRFERDIEMPDRYIFAVASSGVTAAKTGNAKEKYNRLSEMCSCIVKLWNKATGESERNIAGIVAGAETKTQQLRDIVAKTPCRHFANTELLARLDQFISESEVIVPAASQALDAGDINEFDRQVAISQELTEKMLENQVPETILLVESARNLGAVAASAFGAGFGGSVWAMIETDSAERFVKNWAKTYSEKFPKTAADSIFLLTEPGPGAFEL